MPKTRNPPTLPELRIALARHELALQTAREFAAQHRAEGNPYLADADLVQASYFSAKAEELKRQIKELAG